MPYIGVSPPSAPLTSSDITDNIITEAKMADDAISIAELKAGTDGEVISWDASGNPVAVGAGTSGQFLKSQGAGSQPVFAAAGGGAHTLLLTTNASDDATIIFNSTYITSTYRDYMLVCSGLTPENETVKLKMYVSSDNGSSYKSGSSHEYASRGFESAGTTAHNAEQNGTTGFQLTDTTTSNDTLRSTSLVINFFNPLSTTFGFSYYANGVTHDVGNDGHVFHSGGYYNADHTDAINNIKFIFTSGEIKSGQFRFYGIT